MERVNGNEPVFVSAGAGFTACVKTGDVLSARINAPDILRCINRRGSLTKQEEITISALRTLIESGHREVNVFLVGFRTFRNYSSMRESARSVFRCADESDTIYRVAAENGKGWKRPVLFLLPKSILNGLHPHPAPPVLGEQSKDGMDTMPVPKKGKQGHTLHIWPNARHA